MSSPTSAAARGAHPSTGSARELASRTAGDLRAGWRASFSFHLLMQILGLALFTPLVSAVANRIVLAAGEPVISNYDIARFVLSPAGVVFVVAVAALTLGLVLAELAGQSFVAAHAIARRRVSAASVVAFVLPRLPRLIRLGARLFVRLALLGLPFLAGLGLVWLTLLRGREINYYLAENPPEWRHAKLAVAALAAGYTLLAAWQLVRWLYAVPALVLENATPAQALSASARLTRGRVAATATPLVVWWLGVTAAMVALTLICRQLSELGFVWAGIDVHRVLPLVALYVTVALVGGFLYGAVHVAGHQFLVTRMYLERRGPESLNLPPLSADREPRTRHAGRVATVAVLGLLAAALGGAWLVASRFASQADVAVTAHRGASVHAPENTLAAFRAALDAGATYVELDVQRARDGRIVVLHDGDFLRVGGDPRKLAELTLDDLATIDIGRKYDAAFLGEHAPTLDEVIALVRGKMKINVELKYNVPDPGLAPAVIDLLRREHFVDQVVITSLDYAALQQVESIEPRLETGHIVTAAVGDVVRTGADFLSLNSAQATRSLIRRAHAAGKKVHVWTVNEPDVMLRMIERGVDNVITDDPALLVRVLHDRNALSRPEILGLGLRVLFTRSPPELLDAGAVEPL